MSDVDKQASIFPIIPALDVLIVNFLTGFLTVVNRSLDGQTPWVQLKYNDPRSFPRNIIGTG